MRYLAFEIGGAGHGNQTYFIGSQFNSTLTALASNPFTIDVDATRLSIISFTTSIPNANQQISLAVESVDENGNTDIDEVSDVTILLGLNSLAGSISADNSPPDPGLTQSLVAGIISWDNIQYSENNDFITLITSSVTLVDDTTGIIEIGTPNDLIVTSNFTLSTNLSVDNVDIQPTGNLTINSGITLSVAGDFNVTGILNGQSGTVNFNAGGNTLQQITGTTNPVNFYNITVTNNGNQGVRSEVNINLRNTLSLLAGAIFDADGAVG